MKKENSQTTEKVKKPIFKKWWFWVIIAVVIIGAIGGGGGNSKKEEPETTATETAATETAAPETAAPKPQSEFEVAINVEGHKEGNGIIFDVSTNLPDEAVLMLSLSNGDYNTDDNFTAQTKVTIADGKASSDPFSNKGEALTGEYDLSISMSLPRLQSDAVRAVIGEKGEYMTGSLVEASTIDDSKTVDALFSVNTDGEITVEPEEDYTHTIFREEDDEEEVTEPATSEQGSDSAANKGFIEKHDNEIVVAAKLALDNFISGYHMSLAPQRWILAKFDETDTVIGMTEITYNNQKGQYIYVGTLEIDDSGKVVSAKPHYLEVNGTVLGDDGYCDEVFDKIKQLTGN